MFSAPLHTCDVVEVALEPHSNADSLSLVMVGDYQCVVKTDDWKDGDLAVYIPPDSVVPETKEFEFLGKHRRIKARKLRGEWSVGLLVPAPPGAVVGDDLMEQLGIVHYEPPLHGKFSAGGDNTSAPSGIFPKYDVHNFKKYSELFKDGEEVVATEKIHGANARYVCVNDVIYCGSRQFWKKEDENNLWWKAIERQEAMQAWLRHNQGLCVYGEVFGQVQNLKYGSSNGQIYFAAFDIMSAGEWLSFDEARKVGHPLPWVPLVYRGGFSKKLILELAERESNWPGAKHHLEGVVVKPVKERIDRRIGRVQLKLVGNRYLSKS